MNEMILGKRYGKSLAVCQFIKKFIDEGDTFSYYCSDCSKEREKYIIDTLASLGTKVEVRRITGIDHNTGVAGTTGFDISLDKS